jgi:hypothetical protein
MGAFGVVAGKLPARQGIPRTARVPRLYALRGYPHQRPGDARGVGARWRMVEGVPPNHRVPLVWRACFAWKAKAGLATDTAVASRAEGLAQGCKNAGAL